MNCKCPVVPTLCYYMTEMKYFFFILGPKTHAQKSGNSSRVCCCRNAKRMRDKVALHWRLQQSTFVAMVSRLFSAFHPNLFKFYGVISLIENPCAAVPNECNMGLSSVSKASQSADISSTVILLIVAL